MSYLYHYSTEEYVELKTLRKQGKIDNEKVKEDMKRVERGDFEEIKYKYAATVPHVMIYPASGIIPIKSIKKVHVY